jgi:1,6-anhydro-N-acetylmuramate kinase
MLALGLNSGPSFDGIDAVLVDIAIGEDGLLKRPSFIAGKTIAWPQKIADQVLKQSPCGKSRSRQAQTY